MFVVTVWAALVLGFLIQQFPSEPQQQRRDAERRELEESAKLRRLQDSLNRARRNGW